MRKSLHFALLVGFACLLSPVAAESHVNCTLSPDHKTVECNGIAYEEVEIVSPTTGSFWIYLLASVFLILFAGLMSGLTIGLMSLDVTTLSVLAATAESPTERANARKLIPILRKQHLLLVTLLLSNAIAMETLPLMLDRIVSAVAAIIISVTAVLFFGEVIPQALCKRYGVAIGANTVYITIVLMFFLFPITWPISKLLDYLLGHSSGTYFGRSQLKELVNLHGVKNPDNTDPLTHNEITMIRGVLEMKEKVASQIMTDVDKMFTLMENTVLTEEVLQAIQDSGHGRIPIRSAADPEEIIGALLTKTLLKINHQNPPTISSLPTAKVQLATKDTPLFSLLNDMILQNIHMAIIKEGGKVVGLVTIEDLVEEMIQEEIDDDPMNNLTKMKVQKKIERLLTGGENGITDRKPSELSSATPTTAPREVVVTVPPQHSKREGSMEFFRGYFKSSSSSGKKKDEESTSLVQLHDDDDDDALSLEE